MTGIAEKGIIKEWFIPPRGPFVFFARGSREDGKEVSGEERVLSGECLQLKFPNKVLVKAG